MEFTRPRGTRDFLFDEMREIKKAESILRNVFENYAYQEIKTPLFEELKLFTTKSGEEIVDQLYNFKDKSDRELTLRPEITAPVARLYLNELQKTASKPIKLYYYGSCFRYERPQKGRFRQFWQFGCELIGAKSPQGEAEVIAMCSESIEKLGIPGADVNINHLGIIRGLFKHFNIDTATQREVMVVIDKGDKDLLKESLTGENPIIDNEELNHVLFKLIDMVGDKSIIKDIEELVAPYPESHDALNELEELIDTLASFKMENYTLNLGVARGLDYYTGTVYETKLDDYPALGSICSGGRYDNLTCYYTDKSLKGVGISIGLTRLFYQLKEAGIIKSDKKTLSKVLIVPFSKENMNYALKVSTALREKNIVCDVYYEEKGLKQKLKYANRLGIPYVCLIGEDEEKEEKVTLKNMETGEQNKVSIEEMINILK